ncbi:MAG: FtsX-like permease family protein [Phycisphaerales bacterium]|nr:FtsX-like permease family protein [Phycisphaerales bacterium]
MSALSRSLPFVWRNMVRRPMRTGLTIAGIATGVFLFTFVESMRAGVDQATSAGAGETTLIVYRKNRFCPFTSQLPQSYDDRIERLPGVRDVIPMKIVVSNCRASLDVVTFRGVPDSSALQDVLGDSNITAGGFKEWDRRSDAALVGSALAERRGLRVGDPLVAAGATAYIAGIFASDDAQDRNSAYVHLNFLQESAKRGGSGGIVTQFVVKVDDPQRLEAVASSIDKLFARDQFPTATRGQTAFVARAAHDIVTLVSFAGWIGYASLIAVFALIANAIALSVRDRVRDHAILQTLGFPGALIGSLVVTESLALAVAGGIVGAVAAFAAVSFSAISFTMEGVSIDVSARPMLAAFGLALAIVLGLVAGVLPAISAARREITASFRTGAA